MDRMFVIGFGLIFLTLYIISQTDDYITRKDLKVFLWTHNRKVMLGIIDDNYDIKEELFID